jgi:hypothetical protein
MNNGETDKAALDSATRQVVAAYAQTRGAEPKKDGCWDDYRLGFRLGAEQERDRANQRLLLLRDRLRERIGAADESSGIEHWHHASGGRSQPTERDGVFVDRQTVLDLIEHEAADVIADPPLRQKDEG